MAQIMQGIHASELGLKHEYPVSAFCAQSCESRLSHGPFYKLFPKNHYGQASSISVVKIVLPAKESSDEIFKLFLIKF